MAVIAYTPRRRSGRGRVLMLVAATAVWLLLAAPAVPAFADPAPGPSAPGITTAPVPTMSASPLAPTSAPATPAAPGSATSDAPAVPPADHHPSGDDGAGDQRCGLTDIGDCMPNVITAFFRKLVTGGLNPLLGLLSATLLTTPSPDSMPRLHTLWSNSWQILLACYGLLILIAGIVVMAYETLQTRHSIKEIAPRIVVGFLAGALSLTLATTAIGLANALARAVSGGVDADSAAATLRNITLKGINHSLFSLFLGLFLVGMLTALLITWVVRVSVTVILIAGAPIALMFHALPHTEEIAHRWWKAFGGCLAIQIVQSLTLTAAMRVFLAPDGFAAEFPTDSRDLVNLIVSVALMLILYKFPFWMLAPLKVGHGRSFAGSIVRGFVAYKVLGALGGRGGHHKRGGARPRPNTRGGGGGGDSAPDPYARVRANAQGQYMLSLPGLKRVPRPTTPRTTTMPAATPRRGGVGRQLTLPLGDDWPENRPVLRRDGQYMLPLPGVRRVTAPAAQPPTATPVSPPTAGRGRQLSLPLGGDWPENKPVLQRDGQYRLPIKATRVARATPPPPPPVPPRQRGKQLELPFNEDPYQGNRALRSGQYPLPLGDLRRVTPAKPTPPPTVPPMPRSPHGEQWELPLNLPKRRRGRPPSTGRGNR